MTFKFKAKLWLEYDSEKVFGDGPCEILKRVEKTGSLRQTAADINMSYSQAWKLIQMIEHNLGFPVLEKQAGGVGGGHSNLTPQAASLTRAYDQFRAEADRELENLFEKYLAPVLNKSN